MRTYDLTPLLRSTVGFDRFNRIFESANRLNDNTPAYPPYDIERTGDDGYRITMAVAGFSESELSVTQKQNSLVIKGATDDKTKDATYLHRGIARRAFERNFELADYVNVTGARIENGLLHVDLARELPEEAKPRTIKIASGEAGRVLEGKAAA
ncbi:MAG: molecular chaperone [Alphaproteobacteria bacterium]|nr:molecular chaperone [Alphaproteobacteria bacterium]|tara:strand:+ start:5667 stop:6128 length:462 start_codon:yes stop_codon:yes gene_type:complete